MFLRRSDVYDIVDKDIKSRGIESRLRALENSIIRIQSEQPKIELAGFGKVPVVDVINALAAYIGASPTIIAATKSSIKFTREQGNNAEA
jgi:hypothetical protein